MHQKRQTEETSRDQPRPQPTLADLDWSNRCWRRAIDRRDVMPTTWPAVLGAIRQMARQCPHRTQAHAIALVVAQNHACQLVYDAFVALSAEPEHLRETLRPLAAIERTNHFWRRR